MKYYLFNTITQTKTYFDCHDSALIALWSMSCEEQCVTRLYCEE